MLLNQENINTNRLWSSMVIQKREDSPLQIDDEVKIKDEKSEESEHFEDEMKDEVNSLPDTQH